MDLDNLRFDFSNVDWRLDNSVFENTKDRVVKYILEAEEKAYCEALISLGWTPPNTHINNRELEACLENIATILQCEGYKDAPNRVMEVIKTIVVLESKVKRLEEALESVNECFSGGNNG